jgi:3D (Asp-Asp-Asp) domain-containing protein
MKTLSNIATCAALALTILLVCVGFVKMVKPIIEPSSNYVDTPTDKDFLLVEMNVSGYCQNECCCGEWADGFTASGVPATGKLIAAPRNYAFGTVMEVPGYGRAVVRDRGGAIKGNKIDLLFPTHQEALNFGRKPLFVKVYNK